MLSQAQIDEIEAKIDKAHEDAYEISKDHKFKSENWLSEAWSEIKKNPMPNGRTIPTGVDQKKVREIGIAISTLPKTGKWHRQIEKIF